MKYLSILIILSLFICTYFVTNAKFGIQGICFLILVFCLAAFSVISIEYEFLGLLFILIYVGAITVMFICVLMIMNEKIVSKKIFFFTLEELGNLILLGGLLYLSNLLSSPLTSYSMQLTELVIDQFDQANIYGQYLFSTFLDLILIAGIILLVAVLGAIVFILDFKKLFKIKKLENLYKNFKNQGFIFITITEQNYETVQKRFSIHKQ